MFSTSKNIFLSRFLIRTKKTKGDDGAQDSNKSPQPSGSSLDIPLTRDKDSSDPYENPQPSTSSCHDIQPLSNSGFEADETNVTPQHEGEPRKKRKRYGQKFNMDWQNQYMWIKEGNQGKPLCVACNINLIYIVINTI